MSAMAGAETGSQAMYRNPEDEQVLSRPVIPQNRSVAALIPIMAVVLIGFLVIGLALPVLPLHVPSLTRCTRMLLGSQRS